MQKSAAVLLHPTSLPVEAGGLLGPTARRFVDGLAAAGFRGWQILPRHPVGTSRSPYAPLSAFAGETSWISVAALREDGWLRDESVSSPVNEAYQTLRTAPPQAPLRRWRAFRDDPLTQSWLPDWCRFKVLREQHRDRPWTAWPTDARAPSPALYKRLAETSGEALKRESFAQFLFFDQWKALSAYAGARDVTLIGDLPIHVSLDSADTWSHRELFHIRENGSPLAWCGVPPDDYSADGQLWRQPPHNWAAHKNDRFRWWCERVRQALVGCDILRLDHFRGYQAWWEVPATDEHARNGRWQPGPAADLFNTLRKTLGALPFWAEDLGIITDEVTALREQFQLPTTRVLQFAFPETSPSAQNEHDPNQIPVHAIAYTGTHDNDTTSGWFENMNSSRRQRIRIRLELPADASGLDVTTAMIDACLQTRAQWAVLPMQDLLGLGSAARMNRPGHETDQWRWRLERDPWDPRRIKHWRSRLARAQRG